MTRGQMLLAGTGRVVLTRVRRADTFLEQARGLLGRPCPGPGEGMLFPGCRSMHTMGMAYAIDLLYLNASGTIIGVEPNLKPYRTSFCRSASAALELAAGEARRLRLARGEALLWRPL